MKSVVLGTLLSVIFFSGCASIMHGTRQPVTFSSQPSEAQVYLDGELKGVTPLTLDLKRGQYESMTISKEGYKPQNREIGDSIDPIFWGNIVIGGVVGSSTDAGTGAMYQYDPNSYFIQLEKTN